MRDSEMICSDAFTLRYGWIDKVVGVSLTLTLATAASFFESTTGRTVMALVLALAIFGTLQAFARRLRFCSEHFSVRDSFWRKSSFSYDDVKFVSFDPTSVLAIVMKSGKVVTFPAKTSGMDEARKLLVARVRSAASGE